MKITTIAIITLLITIPIAANVVFNPLRAVNAANAIYKEEQ